MELKDLAAHIGGKHIGVRRMEEGWPRGTEVFVQVKAAAFNGVASVMAIALDMPVPLKDQGNAALSLDAMESGEGATRLYVVHDRELDLDVGQYAAYYNHHDGTQLRYVVRVPGVTTRPR